MAVKGCVDPVAVELDEVGHAIEELLAVARLVHAVGDGVQVPLRRGAGDGEPVDEPVAAGLRHIREDGRRRVGGESRARAGRYHVSRAVADAADIHGIAGARGLRAGGEGDVFLPREKRGAGDGEAGDAEVRPAGRAVGDGFIEADDEPAERGGAFGGGDERGDGVARQDEDVEDARDVVAGAIGGGGPVGAAGGLAADAHRERVGGIAGGAPVVDREKCLARAVVMHLHAAVRAGRAGVIEVVCRGAAGVAWQDAGGDGLRVVRRPELDVARGNPGRVGDNIRDDVEVADDLLERGARGEIRDADLRYVGGECVHRGPDELRAGVGRFPQLEVVGDAGESADAGAVVRAVCREAGAAREVAGCGDVQRIDELVAGRLGDICEHIRGGRGRRGGQDEDVQDAADVGAGVVGKGPVHPAADGRGVVADADVQRQAVGAEIIHGHDRLRGSHVVIVNLPASVGAGRRAGVAEVVGRGAGVWHAEGICGGIVRRPDLDVAAGGRGAVHHAGHV